MKILKTRTTVKNIKHFQFTLSSGVSVMDNDGAF